MQTGISTASLFGRMPTEDALEFLNKNNIPVAEVFLESYCEYANDFGKILQQRKGDIKVHSVHTLTTQFEPQLYSINERAQNDAFKLLDMTMSTAKMIDATYYTFHGGARFKKTPFVINFERVGEITKKIMDVCSHHGVTLAYENVHWAYYNYIGFFTELKKRVPNLKATFDVKQARQSGIDYREFIDEMGESIVTAHLSDVDASGKMCLPGRGVTDFNDMFTRLCDKGFDGALIMEVYQNDFQSYRELFDSFGYINDLAKKVFKR
jgi:sugar phosphate isomerase/epimerase